MKTKKNKKSGFTLVELMIVAAIIAILAAIVIPMLASNKQRAIASEGQNLLGSVVSACKVYYAENDSWPAAFTNLPSLTTNELSKAKYFTTSNLWVSTCTLNAYTVTVTAAANAGTELSGKTLTLNNNGEWGGDFVTQNIVKK